MTKTVGHTKNKHGIASNQYERIYDASVIGRFLPKINTTSLFVLCIQAVFVKLKLNPHFFAIGQANIRGITRNSLRNIYERLY